MPGIKRILKKVATSLVGEAFFADRIIDAKAINHFLTQRQRKAHGFPIRVGFLCQYLPGWTKVEEIYLAMEKDPRFETVLICLPTSLDRADNDILVWCQEKGYPALDARNEDGSWRSLEALNLDYVFYMRPYNYYMPPLYSSWNVSKHSRICLLMYGITFSKEDTQISLNRDFMSHVYFFFAESAFIQRENIRNNRLPHALGLQKTLFLGNTALENLQMKKAQESASWDFSKNAFRVMWTPRWTTDKKIGGTNFFTYYESILDFAEENPQMDFLHRPHPLAISHFLETGELTQEQADQYKNRCERLPNVAMDTRQSYEATFWGSSVLVSDISGIVPEYFSTGKPLVFCASNMELELAPYMQRLLTGCYVVYNSQELFDILRQLEAGKDPLRQTRQTLIKELFGDLTIHPAAAIVETIVKDAVK